jgi:hypothetical protein
VIGQEGLDTALEHQLSTQSGGIEQLTVGIAVTLHLPILDDRCPNREYLTAIYSTVS